MKLYNLIKIPAIKEKNKGKMKEGQLIGLKPEINCEVTLQSENHILLYIGQNRSIYSLAFVYSAPNSTPHKTLQSIAQSTKPEEPLLILGANARVGEEYTSAEDLHISFESILQPRKSKDNNLNKAGKKLIKTCIEEGLTILNGKTKDDLHGQYTYVSRIGAGTIDLGICNISFLNLNFNFAVLDWSESDHFSIFLNNEKKTIYTETETYKILGEYKILQVLGPYC